MLIVIIIDNDFMHALFGIGLHVFIHSLLCVLNCKSCNSVKFFRNLIAALEPISFNYWLLTLPFCACISCIEFVVIHSFLTVQRFKILSIASIVVIYLLFLLLISFLHPLRPVILSSPVFICYEHSCTFYAF